MFSPRSSGPKSPRKRFSVGPAKEAEKEATAKDKSPRSTEGVSPQRSPRMSAAEVASPRTVLALLRPRAGTDRSLPPSPLSSSAPPPLPLDPPGVRQWKVHLAEGTLSSERLSGDGAAAATADEEEDLFEFSLSSDSGQLCETALLPVARVEQSVFGDLDPRLEGLLALLFPEAQIASPEPGNGMHWALRIEGGPVRVMITVNSSEVTFLLAMQHVAQHTAFVQRKVARKVQRALSIICYARANQL